MISVITGDIINSRKLASQKAWIAPLKKILATHGKSPKNWEIFRGDSFQLEIKEPENALLVALKIKAAIRSVKGLDVRMAIGTGDKNYNAKQISESNGTAFINSGEKFEDLKKLKRRLAVKSPWPGIDKSLNLMISLAAITMDKWSVTSAEMVAVSLQYKHLPQTSLGKKIKRTQSSVSERQKRAHYDEIIELEQFYRETITDQFH